MKSGCQNFDLMPFFGHSGPLCTVLIIFISVSSNQRKRKNQQLAKVGLISPRKVALKSEKKERKILKNARAVVETKPEKYALENFRYRQRPGTEEPATEHERRVKSFCERRQLPSLKNEIKTYILFDRSIQFTIRHLAENAVMQAHDAMLWIGSVLMEEETPSKERVNLLLDHMLTAPAHAASFVGFIRKVMQQDLIDDLKVQKVIQYLERTEIEQTLAELRAKLLSKESRFWSNDPLHLLDDD
jgi:hypothetical protein